MERLSTNLLYRLFSSQVAESQSDIFKLSKSINSGKKFSSPHDDPSGIISAIQTQGKIIDNDQTLRNNDANIAELSTGEIALRTMKDVLDRITEIAIGAANDTASDEERTIFKNELRTHGEFLIQLANSKSGNKFVFSGKQSNIQTLRLTPNAALNSVTYKDNQDDGEIKNIDGIASGVSIKEAFISDASSAVLTSQIINPILASSGSLDMQVNDGNGNLVDFSVNLSSGDTLSSVITKINNAFNTAGGLGSIASESPTGYLKMDTDLVTGDSKNSIAKVQIKASSSSTITNELYLKKQSSFGKDAGLMQTLSELETALSANDGATIRDLVGRLRFNSEQISSLQSRIGLLVAQVERSSSTADDLDIKLQSDLSNIQDVDIIATNLKLANAQAALQTAIQTSSNFFSQSLLNFVS
jgi:flagellar hook-associated protein 3 FlgL